VKAMLHSSNERNSAYRKDRYLRHTAEKKGRIYFFSALLTLLALIATVYIGYKKMDELNAQLKNRTETIDIYEQELEVLRTINPYQIESNDIVKAAIENSDVFPGWVTRVYSLPASKSMVNKQSDVGSFVMNGTQFTLASHQMHGIEQPIKSMYRLSGLLPSLIKGRHQIGVEFNFEATQDRFDKNTMSKIGSCFAKVVVNHKRVIDKKVNIVSRFSTSQVLTGEVELGKGLFPIDALIYCDEKSDYNDKEVEVSFSFRNPTQQRLSRRSNSVFHIYSPKLANVL
jgi:hypothetical protein